MGIIIYI